MNPVDQYSPGRDARVRSNASPAVQKKIENHSLSFAFLCHFFSRTALSDQRHDLFCRILFKHQFWLCLSALLHRWLLSVSFLRNHWVLYLFMLTLTLYDCAEHTVRYKESCESLVSCDTSQTRMVHRVNPPSFKVHTQTLICLRLSRPYFTPLTQWACERAETLERCDVGRLQLRSGYCSCGMVRG